MTKINIYILTLIISVNLLYASGWHIAEQIYPGTFNSGDFIFDGDVNITTGNDICIDGGNCLSSVSFNTSWGDARYMSSGTDNWINSSGDTIDVGRGAVYLENNVNDGDGAGITIRTSANPTNGSIFSVRSSGEAPRLWVGQSMTGTSNSDLRVSINNDGTGGTPVWHAGNDGSGSGLDADTVDGLTSATLRTALSCNGDTECEVNAISDPDVGTIRDNNGGWIRTYGSTGWYSQTYGGGWYMYDTTYIRNYGSKKVYLNNYLYAPMMYDQDNTAWYVNPSGTSRQNGIRAATICDESGGNCKDVSSGWDAGTISCSGAGWIKTGRSSCDATKVCQSYTCASLYCDGSKITQVGTATCYDAYNPYSVFCFVAGTKVHMYNGIITNIEDIEKGDYVLNEFGEKDLVLDLLVHKVGMRGTYIINDNIESTGDHPFMTKDGWKVADLEEFELTQANDGYTDIIAEELEIGDVLITKDGEEKIKSIELTNQRSFDEDVYTLVLEKGNAFYANGYLVAAKK